MELAKLETKLAHERGAELRVIGPDGKTKTDFYITVVGLDSAVWRSMMRDYQREMVQASITGDKVDHDKRSPEMLAKATLSWRGLTDNGEEVAFSQETAEQLYFNAPYIADQLDNFIAKRKNF
jgi:hypothetical protein